MSQQINLYNPLFLKQEKLFSLRTMAQALAAIAVGLGAIYAYALYETRLGEELAHQYRTQVAVQRAEFVQLTKRLSPQGTSKVLASEVARLDAEVKARRATLEALASGEVGNAEGFSEYLAAFGRGALPGVWLTGLDVGERGAELVVRGGALRPELMPTYLERLGAEPVMRGRRIAEMRLTAKSAPPAKDPDGKSGEPRKYVEFVVTAPLQAAGARERAQEKR